MNKADLIKHVASESGISQAQAEKAINSFTSGIQQSLTKGETVTLIGFGSFSVSERAARNGRNPQTGAVLKIPAKKLPKFSAGKALKEAVAGPVKKSKKK
ncbi:HU family DNA-binding protein [Sphingobacterium alkalisoli]|uniref:HU family DNA-binding protein n=1 Tax=Sphingobacterium alkalisoli TaxID=1874115 RepID=A0A4U0H4K6_9SPHI|nr:HU family DNA-binding protein [Sphingobacterium alkalisoli]TJY66600.1 HU family DNA-binding protein [Sphingobacterium alkalisoli]GGH15404.1 transcriptional regulator [Sphingobacterium alkalisoli]